MWGYNGHPKREIYEDMRKIEWSLWGYGGYKEKALWGYKREDLWGNMRKNSGYHLHTTNITYTNHLQNNLQSPTILPYANPTRLIVTPG